MSLRGGLLALGLALSSSAAAQTPTPEAPPLLLRETKAGVMGTSLQITVLGPDAKALEAALAAALKEIKRVEDVFTTWRVSPLNRLNAAAGKGPQPASREVCRLLARARRLGGLTRGAFDLSFAGVGKLWDFKRRPPKLPTAAEVKAALRVVDYKQVAVDLKQETVTIPAGFRVGLGGIAKGYGVDRAMAVLLKLKIRHALVNAGGDLKALGRKQGKAWEIAIKHPRERTRVLAVLPVSNTCVVTSGDYERFFEHKGRRYHHILDPRTGYPSQGCMSATVIAPDAAFADALATAICVLGVKEGLAIVERLKRVEAIAVDMQGKVHLSSGIPQRSLRKQAKALKKKR